MRHIELFEGCDLIVGKLDRHGCNRIVRGLKAAFEVAFGRCGIFQFASAASQGDIA
jgi:hypothetical protein